MLTFAVAVFLLMATPGPGVLSAAGFGAAFGFRAGLRWVTGLFLGNALVIAAVLTGLSALILAYPAIRWVLGLVAIGYLFYLAWRVATAGKDLVVSQAKAPPGIGAAIALQLINPKAYAVNGSLFSAFAFHPNFAVEVALKLLIINAIWIPIHLIWLQGGVVLHRLALGPTAQRRINIAMALAMVGVVVLALISASDIP